MWATYRKLDRTLMVVAEGKGNPAAAPQAPACAAVRAMVLPEDPRFWTLKKLEIAWVSERLRLCRRRVPDGGLLFPQHLSQRHLPAGAADHHPAVQLPQVRLLPSPPAGRPGQHHRGQPHGRLRAGRGRGHPAPFDPPQGREPRAHDVQGRRLRPDLPLQHRRRQPRAGCGTTETRSAAA